MIFDRSLLEAAIAARLSACSFDELRVIDRVLQGIEQGREQYGPLDVSRDIRDWRREGAQEMRDWLFYCAAHEVAAEQFARECRLERIEEQINAGLDEMREIEPEQSIAMPAALTDELRICCCGHPESVHAASGCLIAQCACMACEVF